MLALDGEAMGAQGRKMRAARDEVHVGTAPRQPGAEIASDAPGPHDGNAHPLLP